MNHSQSPHTYNSVHTGKLQPKIYHVIEFHCYWITLVIDTEVHVYYWFQTNTAYFRLYVHLVVSSENSFDLIYLALHI